MAYPVTKPVKKGEEFRPTGIPSAHVRVNPSRRYNDFPSIINASVLRRVGPAIREDIRSYEGINNFHEPKV